jgi:hypothetical protein
MKENQNRNNSQFHTRKVQICTQTCLHPIYAVLSTLGTVPLEIVKFQLTPWSRVPKKLPTHLKVVVFTSARHWTTPWTKWFQSTSENPVSIIHILIFMSRVSQVIFYCRYYNKNVCMHSSCHIHTTRPAHHFTLQTNECSDTHQCSAYNIPWTYFYNTRENVKTIQINCKFQWAHDLMTSFTNVAQCCSVQISNDTNIK